MCWHKLHVTVYITNMTHNDTISHHCSMTFYVKYAYIVAWTTFVSIYGPALCAMNITFILLAS
jgi:hypothetical protein